MKNGQKAILRDATLVLAMAVVTSVSWGQVQRVQVGRALDANPLVGSGGSNQPISGYIPGQANGNDIVTGNVAGLAYFHGRIPEFAPGTFEGHLGSADLDAFARQSAGGIPTSYGPQPFFLPSTVVSTAQGNIYSTPYGGGFDSRYVPASSLSPLNQQVNGAYSGAVVPLRSFDQSSQITDNGAMTPGRAIQSPLFSLRPESQPRIDTNLPPSEQTLNAPIAAPSFTPKPDDQKSDQNTDEKTGEPTDNGNGTNADGTVSQKNTGALNERVKVASGVSQRVDGRTEDFRAAQIASEQLASSQLRVSDTYKELQKNLDKAQGIDANATDTTGQNPQKPDDNGTGNNAFARNDSKEAVDANGKPLPKPQPTMTDGSMARNGARTPELDNGIHYQSTDPALPGYRPRASIEARATRLEDEPKSVLQAGKKVDPLKSLTAAVGGTPPTSFDTNMQKGESLMKAGKYLDAAESYQNALTLQPDDPLALLGRGNAELAAGMFQSAAFDLKYIFTHKPALISVRYTLENYMPTGRQDVLIRELTEMSTANQDMGNLGSFLLCYLCYNTDREKDLEGELGRWKARPWHDSWETVAEKAWGK